MHQVPCHKHLSEESPMTEVAIRSNLGQDEAPRVFLDHRFLLINLHIVKIFPLEFELLEHPI